MTRHPVPGQVPFPCILAVLVALFSICVFSPAQAHPADTASLSMKEVTPGRFIVAFKAGSRTLQEQLAVPALYPSACQVHDNVVDCGKTGLTGTIKFPWLEGTLTRLLVDIQWHDGSRLLRVLSAKSPSLTVYGIVGTGATAIAPIVQDYALLGVEHIIGGFDHLLFVIALALLVKGRRALIGTITAFTLAHSLTLAATALGLVALPIAPVEAMIALSIVLVCVECLRPEISLTRRAPWMVAFTFGLLHGFGFASALLEIGLPQQHLSSALFSFNVGVELGQLAVIVLFFIVRDLARRLNVLRPWMAPTIIYCMGTLAAFWSLQRIIVVFEG